jgi:hypothetical protein
MNRPIKNPETEALARHIAGAVVRGDQAAIAFGCFRWYQTEPVLWVNLAFSDRVRALVKELRA